MKKVPLLSLTVLMLLTLPIMPVLAQSKINPKSRTFVNPMVDDNPIDRTGKWGVGLILGDPSGLTLKYWQNEDRAFDFSIGSQLGDGGLGINADYLFHLRPFQEAPEAPVYVGGGLFLGGSSSSFSTGARAVFGITYLFEDPFDIFFELAPKFYVAPALEFSMSLSIGGRIYF